MVDTCNYQPHQRISYKDIMQLMIVSESSARRYFADIKETLALQVVTYKHYTDYFKLQ